MGSPLALTPAELEVIESLADPSGPRWSDQHSSERESAPVDFSYPRMTNLSSAAASIELPTSDLEEWRYSRIGDIDLAAYSVAAPVAGALPEGLLAVRDVVPERAATVLVRNGRVVAVDIDRHTRRERLASRAIRRAARARRLAWAR